MNKFKVAFTGMIKGIFDHSIRIQLCLMCCALTAGIVLSFNWLEWTIVLLCCGLVVVSEYFNTCIERLCDLYCDAFNEKIRYIKDLGAGAVLFASCIALSCALIILFQHI